MPPLIRPAWRRATFPKGKALRGVFMGYEYLCSAGEAFDSVALAVYGDEKYAAELMAANGEYLQRMVFSGGERLALPEIGTVLDRTGEDTGTAPWK